MPELGKATFTLGADPSEFEAGLRQAERVGQRFFNNLERDFKAAATGIAAAAGGLLAVQFSKALTTGFRRLTTIQDATQALTINLGDAGKAAEFLGEILETVRGTPFNLDEFAKAGQQMVSFGADAEKVPGFLTAIGEAAATQGSQASFTAQRLSLSFSQMIARNRIFMDDLHSLSSAGVNALAILGNHFDVTAAKMQEMVSKGEVPVKEALDVLTEGILKGSEGVNGATVAFEGTMEGLRKTLSGAKGGFASALARLGVAVFEPLSKSLTEGFTSMTEVVDKMTARVEEFVTDLVGNPNFKKFMDFLREMPERFDRLGGALDRLAPILGMVGGALGGMVARVLHGIPVLGAFVPAIGGPTGALIGLVAASDAGRKAVGSLGGVLADAGKRLMPPLMKALEQVAGLAERLVPILVDVAVKLAPVLATAIEVIIEAMKVILPMFGAFADVLGFLADKQILSFVAGMVAVAAILKKVGDLIEVSKIATFGAFMLQAGSATQTAAEKQMLLQQGTAKAAAAGLKLGAAFREFGATLKDGAIIGAAARTGKLRTVLGGAAGAARAFGASVAALIAKFAPFGLILAGITAALWGVHRVMSSIRKANQETADSFVKDSIPAMLRTGKTLTILAKDWNSGPFGTKNRKNIEAVFDRFNKGLISGTDALIELGEATGHSEEETRDLIASFRDAEITSKVNKGHLTGLAKAVNRFAEMAAFGGREAFQLGEQLKAAGVQGKALDRILSNIKDRDIRIAIKMAVDASSILGPLKGLIDRTQRLINAGFIEKDAKLRSPMLDALGLNDATLGEVKDFYKDLKAMSKEGKEDVETGGGTGDLDDDKAKNTTLKDARQAARQGLRALQDLRKAGKKMGRMLLEGFDEGFREGIKALGKGVRTTARILEAAQQAWKGYVAVMREEGKKVSKRMREHFQEFRKEGRKLLRQAQELAQKMASLGNAVRQGIRGSLDPVAEFNNRRFMSSARLQFSLKRRIEEAKEFGRILKKLAKKGLNRAMLQDLAEAGPSAIGLARAMLETGVEELNQAQRQINRIAGKTADVVVQQKFGGEVNRLATAFDDFGKHARKFTADLRALFKSAGIPVPQLAKGGLVTSPTMAIIGEKGPELVIPLDKLGPMLEKMNEGKPSEPTTINFHEVAASADDVLAALNWRDVTKGM